MKFKFIIIFFIIFISKNLYSDETSEWLKREIDIILEAYKNQNLSNENRFLLIEETINNNFAGTGIAKFVAGDGFYIVLPLFGPSNLRDTSGMVLTMMTDPINAYAVSEGEAWLVPMRTAVNAVDTRSQIIDEVNALRDNSVDYYAAVRSSYYQNRKAAINNVDDSELTPLPLISIEFE